MLRCISIGFVIFLIIFNNIMLLNITMTLRFFYSRLDFILFLLLSNRHLLLLLRIIWYFKHGFIARVIGKQDRLKIFSL